MAKPEWGTKRICPSCGTRYYDLLREQVICPKCSTPYDPEAFLKARRARPATPVEKEPAPVGDDAEAEDVETVEDEEEEAVPLAEGEEEEDEEMIEDASELGEDEDDMAEVIDNVEEEEP
ncbi:MAG: TIGR02300 family protein [Stellaceae bacterium]